ncbi:hypothetical protein GF324_07565 [bacterium]|nr:hypothetical protein [bacterium]
MTVSMEPLPADRPVRVGMIGLGGGAQVIHLPILDESDSVEIVGVCDVDAYKVSRIANRYNVEGFLDAVNMLKITEPDVVLICTPTITHLPLALNAMERGAHVIIEKPVTRNLDEALRLQQAARDREKLVLVAMNLRFRQDVSVLKNFLTAGELGDIWRVRAGWLKRRVTWSRSPWLHKPSISGGGVLMDLGMQMIDVVHWMLGGRAIDRVIAFSHHEALGLEVEDTVCGAIHYKDGPVFLLDVSWGLMAESSLSYAYFEGKTGSAQLDPLTVYKSMQGEMVNVSPVRSGSSTDLYRASFEAQMYQFLQILRGEREPVSTIDEAVDVMRIVEMIYRSAGEHREIGAGSA